MEVLLNKCCHFVQENPDTSHRDSSAVSLFLTCTYTYLSHNLVSFYVLCETDSSAWHINNWEDAEIIKPLFRRLSFVFLVTLSVVSGCGGGASEETTSDSAVPLGVNLERVADWGRSIMFADAMKHARHWGSVNMPHDEQAPVDANGWPTGDAGVVIMINVPHMAGVYKLSFTGHATVAPVVPNDSTTRVQNMAYDAGTNTSTADVRARAERDAAHTRIYRDLGRRQERQADPPRTPSVGHLLQTLPRSARDVPSAALRRLFAHHR